MAVTKHRNDIPAQQHTRRGDYTKIRDLEARLRAQAPPRVLFTREQKIDISRQDWLLAARNIFSYDPEPFVKLAKESKNPASLIVVARKYFSIEKYDVAFDYLRDAMDCLSGNKPVLSFGSKLAFLNTRFASWFGRTILRRDVQMCMFSAAYESITAPEHAWYYSALGKLVADTFGSPFDREMYVFDALLASAQGRSDRQEAWKAAVLKVRECSDEGWRRLSETRSVVRVLDSPFFSNTFLFKENASLDSLLLEARSLFVLTDLLPDCSVPQPLYVSEMPDEGRHYLVLRYIPGATLFDKLKSGDKSAMPSVISALARIHAGFPTENLPLLDIKGRLRGKLYDRNVGLPRDLADSILENLSPVYDALSLVPWVWNKDAHPENWIIGEKVGVIDCEADHIVPALFDMANLLEYDDFFAQEEKRAYIFKYNAEAQNQGRRIPRGMLFPAYYTSVVYRMLSLAAAWSSPDRMAMRSKRAGAIGRAIRAIRYLQRDEPAFYQRNAGKCSALCEVLVKVREHLAYTS